MRKITGIIIHCTATRPDWWAGKRTFEKVAEIKRWHVDGNGWSDIGYHYLIDLDGTIAKGRDVERTGAHLAATTPAQSVLVCSAGMGQTRMTTSRSTSTPRKTRRCGAYLTSGAVSTVQLR